MTPLHSLSAADAVAAMVRGDVTDDGSRAAHRE